MEKGKLNLPKAQFHPTGRAGVVYLVAGNGERRYYIRYRTPDGKQRFEKVSIPGVRMTPAKADQIRGDRARGKELPNQERREAKKAEKEAEAGRWTFSRLFDAYLESRGEYPRRVTDDGNFRKHLLDEIGDKTPAELSPFEADKIRLTMLKKYKPGTVVAVLGLLVRLSSFGVKRRLCEGIKFSVELPKVNNLKTEDLTPEQMARLLAVLRDGIVVDKDGKKTLLDPDAREIMLMAIFTGMRRGEIFRLKWEDVDFQRGFIAIRGPKGGTDQTIPLPDEARELLERRPRRKDCPYIFPGRPDGKKKGTPEYFRPKADASKHFWAIRKAAKLPTDFRPMHGLRHVFASMLASSGEVDLYTLQKLLTHKSPMMTQRYAHLRDETLKKASNVAGRIIAATEKKGAEDIG
jgi:integrase